METLAQRNSVNISAWLLHPGDYKERRNQPFSPLSLAPFSRVKICLPYADDWFLEDNRILVSVIQACGCFRYTGVTHKGAIILFLGFFFPFGEGRQGSNGVRFWSLFSFLKQESLYWIFLKSLQIKDITQNSNSDKQLLRPKVQTSGIVTKI